MGRANPTSAVGIHRVHEPGDQQADYDQNSHPADDVDNDGQVALPGPQVAVRLLFVVLVAALVADHRPTEHGPDRAEVPRPGPAADRPAAALGTRDVRVRLGPLASGPPLAAVVVA